MAESCEVLDGASAVLLIAPHGGRRPPVDAAAPPPTLRVNDVYTPEVTRLLGAALRAGWVINHTIDRNALDLNRISQVRRRAPWFLTALTQAIGRVIARCGHAELVFVHGWNTGQTTCDIGIGAAESAGALRVPDGARLTVDGAYRRERVGALRAACAARGIRAPIGERYPATHPNNLLQLFTARAAEIDDPCAREIAAWVRAGRLNAVQLEIGIPLRWPGTWRDQFVAAVAEAFANAPRPRDPAGVPAAATETLPSSHRSTALQCYDPAADVGISAGVGRMGPHGTAGRLLLYLGGQRVALFTGEEPHPHADRVGPLSMTVSGDAGRLHFAGPILALDDARHYLDLEAALAASRLISAEVDLAFSPAATHPGAAAQFGTVRGSLRAGNRTVTIATCGFVHSGAFRASGPGRQTMLAAAFGTAEGVLWRAADGGNTGTHFRDGRADPLAAVRVAVSTDGDAYTPSQFELACNDRRPIVGTPLSRMGILRPLGGGRYLRVTFGTARFTWAEANGYGLYEYARPVEAHLPPAH
jgi:hypothetical protein